MKKVIYSLLFVFAAAFTACEEELPKANFDLYELKSLEASAGDMNVTLTWEDYENARPSEYLVIWTAGTADADGGQMTVEAEKKSIVIEKLENDMTYSFFVQPRYASGLAGKMTVSCTPKNARYPVTNFKATAGSERVRLTWSKPNSERFTNYQIVVNPGGNVVTLDDTSLESYIMTGLTNDTEYTFSITASYPTGNSETVEVSATPGKVSPILIDRSEKMELSLWEPAMFTLNDMFFMGGDVQSVSWNFGDGATSKELTPKHAYGVAADKYMVSVTVTYADGTTDTGSMEVKVVNYRWDSVDLKLDNYNGDVKASNPVFSLDGKTLYIPTTVKDKSGHLFAIDVASGEVKWAFAIDHSNNKGAGGALVGDDGIIYQCVGDNSKDNVYAIKPDGTKYWSVKLDAGVDAFPALSTDGKTLYCLTNKTTLYALNVANGEFKWTQGLDASGTGSAVAVDKAGNIYAGTNAKIYSYTSEGVKRWETAEETKVTEAGAFAMSGKHLYATLKNPGGLISVNMETGEKEWNYSVNKGDSYFPVVDKNGVIYFTEKASANVYAVNPANGNGKWTKGLLTATYNLIYNGLALSDDGILYLGTQKGTTVFGLNTSNGEVSETITNAGQIMAGVTIGPDKRLYCGTIKSETGAIRAFAIGKAPELSSWSMRGGDLQGTNRQK